MTCLHVLNVETEPDYFLTFKKKSWVMSSPCSDTFWKKKKKKNQTISTSHMLVWQDIALYKEIGENKYHVTIFIISYPDSRFFLMMDVCLGFASWNFDNRYFTILYYYGINRIPNSLLQTPRHLHIGGRVGGLCMNKCNSSFVRLFWKQEN